MASYKRRQSSDYNQSVPETQFVPEQHAYQEKHFQPVLNQPVSETHAETEYGATVTPDEIESRADRGQHTTYTEQSDQPGEDDMAKMQVRQNLQNNSDPGTQYSTPDVSSGVSSGPGGFAAAETSTAAAATTTAATTTVAASTAATTLTTVATATAGVAIITVAFILPLIVGVPSAIIFDEISVTDTTVYYSIYFEDYEEDMDLTVSLQNNFTDRSHKVDSHSISVLEENLKPGMQYRLIVYGSMGAVLDERTVTTSKEPPAPSGPTFDVETAEFSLSDGLIHLSATLNDPEGIYSDFSLVLYDGKGGASIEVNRISVTDFSNEITMSPRLASDTYVNGTLAVECKEGGNTKVLYEKELTAYGDPYIGFKTSPGIKDGTIPVECIIVDSGSVRSNYTAFVYVADAANDRDYYDKNGVLENGVYTFTNVPNYTFHTGEIKVTWDGEGSGAPLVYQYNTMTVGAAGLRKITSDPYDLAQFSIDIALNDDLNHLTDSSGNWRSDKYPTLYNNDRKNELDFVEIRKTGDNTYTAVFSGVSWGDAQTYYLAYNDFTVDGATTSVYFFYTDGYTVSTFRDADNTVRAKMTFKGGDSGLVDTVRAFDSDRNEIVCTVTPNNQEYGVNLDFVGSDPLSIYSMYLYDNNGRLLFRQDNVTFEYPRLISATYALVTSPTSGEEVAEATVQFEYSVTPVYIPQGQSEIISSENPETTSGILTLRFTVAKNSPILTGDQYFEFAVADTTSSDYYWYAVFEQLT